MIPGLSEHDRLKAVDICDDIQATIKRVQAIFEESRAALEKFQRDVIAARAR